MKLFTTLLYSCTAIIPTLIAGAVANNPDCAVSSSTSGPIAYRYYARGRNCASNSDLERIESALHNKFNQLDSEDLRKPECVQFDVGGPWQGWVLYGRAGEVDLAHYCGPSMARTREL